MVEVEATGQTLGFNNSNALVKNQAWDIQLQKTGYIREAGKCVVMLVNIASKPFVIVLLDSFGKYTRIADAQRVKHWLETGESLVIADAEGDACRQGEGRERQDGQRLARHVPPALRQRRRASADVGSPD